MERDRVHIASGVIGHQKSHCTGYLDERGGSYVTALKLSIGQVPTELGQGRDRLVAFDRAEREDAYLGQINMVPASSFCGGNCVLWGYHMAKAVPASPGGRSPLFTKRRHDGHEIPVYSASPLLDAAERLFGRADQRRFNMSPGALVPCATTQYFSVGPAIAWGALGVAVAEDGDQSASLFIEDVGDDPIGPPETGTTVIDRVAESAVLCGRNQGVMYKEIYVAYRSRMVADGMAACVLVCIPYFKLARSAVPRAEPGLLLDTDLHRWESALNLPPLSHP